MIQFGGRKEGNIKHADDIVLNPGNKEDLQTMRNRVNQESENFGLRLKVNAASKSPAGQTLKVQI